MYSFYAHRWWVVTDTNHRYIMKLKQGKNKYEVFGHEISYLYNDDWRLLNLSDIALMSKSDTVKHIIVQNWLKSKDTIRMIQDAESSMYGRSTVLDIEPFSMDIYAESLSIIVKRGRTGGIYALDWIACEFLKHLFPDKRFSLNIIFKDECDKAQKRIELSKVREQLKFLFGQKYPDKDTAAFIMMNYHKSACKAITGHTPSALKVSLGEPDDYCPSNDFTLAMIEETIKIYKFYIKQLLGSGEYHTKLLLTDYQKRVEALKEISMAWE